MISFVGLANSKMSSTLTFNAAAIQEDPLLEAKALDLLHGAEIDLARHSRAF